MAPAADEGDIIEEGCPRDLLQGLNDIIDIDVTHQDSQPEAALQLLDAVVYVFRFEQMKPAGSGTMYS